MLHSNPGDYAWGQGGLDAVITQVNQNELQLYVLATLWISLMFIHVCCVHSY